MGYEGGYTLTQRCASEFVATWMFIFLLLSVLANKLLPKTKGHDIGFGWVAFGIGLACFLPVQYFGYISSMVNPAMALANCIAGVIDWSDLLPIMAAQFAGAFLGGCTVWLHYLPHFATVPEPPPTKIADELLRTRDYINSSSLAYASYSTILPPPVNTFAQGLQQFKKVMKGNSRFRAYRDEDILGRHFMIGRSGVTRRRSINESDLHERIRRHRPEHRHHTVATPKKETPFRRERHVVDWPMSSDDDDVHQSLLHGRSPSLKEAMGQAETAIDITDGESKKTGGHLPKDMSMRSLQALVNHDAHSGVFYEPGSELGSDPGSDFIDSGDDRRQPIDPLPFSNLQTSLLETPIIEKDEEDENNKKHKLTKTQRLHEASVKADQNAKLAVFATRPAVFVPVCNLINEIIGTMLLTSGILMLNQRGGMIWKGDNEVYMHGLKSFWVGILVLCLVLCLGGPGIAINPCRDLGPRVAHWILPIAGKGVSEWYYGWIPVVGPFIGGAIGGYFYILCDMLNESNKSEGYLETTINAIGATVNATADAWSTGHVEL